MPQIDPLRAIVDKRERMARIKQRRRSRPQPVSSPPDARIARPLTSAPAADERPLIETARQQAAQDEQARTRAARPAISGMPGSDAAEQPTTAAESSALVAQTAELEPWKGPDQSYHPWEQQPGESSAEYACFLAYLNLGPARTLRDAYLTYFKDKAQEHIVADPYGVPNAWAMMSPRWGWVDRAEQFDAWDAQQDLEKTRRRMKADRETRHEHRERARRKLMTLIEAMDPNLVELRPGDLFRAVSLLNDDARQDLDRVVEKAETAKEQSATDILGGAMTLAQIVQLANRARSEQQAGMPAPERRAALRAADQDADAIDADYVDVG